MPLAEVEGIEIAEAHFYLSRDQSEILQQFPDLQRFIPDLPCWVPHRIVALALGHGTAAIEAAEAAHGPYLWATELENVHATWFFEEPGFAADGYWYEGPEQYFQSHKHEGIPSWTAEAMEFADQVSRADPMEANRLGRSVPLRADWEEVKDDVMHNALRAKFTQDADLIELLLATRPHPLVPVKPDAYWGAGLDGRGDNKQGSILRQLRDEFGTIQGLGGLCPHGAECTQFKSMQIGDYSERGYNHCVSLEHPIAKCSEGKQCPAHRRLIAGGHRFDDVCHHAVAFHGRVRELGADGSAMFSMIKSYQTRAVDFAILGKQRIWFIEADKQLEALLTEVRNANLEYILGDRGQLLDVARAKRQHPHYLKILNKRARRKVIGDGKTKDWTEPTDAEILGCLIYTGTDAQGDIRKWLRSPREEMNDCGLSADERSFNTGGKWGYTCLIIRSAVNKLEENPPHWGFHGLNGVKVEPGEIFQYINFISLSMSNYVSTAFAKGEGGTVDQQAACGTVLHVDCRSFQQVSGSGAEVTPEQRWVFADMRWISKFADEREWLMVPRYTGHWSFCHFESLPPSSQEALPSDLRIPGIRRILMRQKVYSW